MKHAPKTENRTTVLPAPKKVLLSQGDGVSQGEEVTVDRVEVVVVPAPSLRRSTSTEKRTKMPTKPISEQGVSMTIEQKQGDRASEATKAQRPPVAEFCSVNDLRLAETNSAVVTRGPADHEVEAEMEVEKGSVATGDQVRHNNNHTIRFH